MEIAEVQRPWGSDPFPKRKERRVRSEHQNPTSFSAAQTPFHNCQASLRCVKDASHDVTPIVTMA